MLPDQWPDGPPTEPPPDRAPARASPPAESPRRAPLFALALFLLGVTIGLLALVGRIAQELEYSLLADFAAGFWRTSTGGPRLPAMIHGLTTRGQRLVAAGFAASLVGMVSGAALWWRSGPGGTALGRAWTRLGGTIALALLAGMACALVWPDASTRLVLLIGMVAPAGLLFVILVLWIMWAGLPGD